MKRLDHLKSVTVVIPEDCNGTPAHEVTVSGIVINGQLK